MEADATSIHAVSLRSFPRSTRVGIRRGAKSFGVAIPTASGDVALLRSFPSVAMSSVVSRKRSEGGEQLEGFSKSQIPLKAGFVIPEGLMV